MCKPNLYDNLQIDIRKFYKEDNKQNYFITTGKVYLFAAKKNRAFSRIN